MIGARLHDVVGRQKHAAGLYHRPLNALARHLAASPSFCSLKAQTGSLRNSVASRVLFKGRVRPLSVEDSSPQPLGASLRLPRQLPCHLAVAYTSLVLWRGHGAGTGLAPGTTFSRLSTTQPFFFLHPWYLR
jgi:hypothetical protein